MFFKLRRIGIFGKTISNMRHILLLILASFVLISCQNNDYSPKPRGFHRIIFPEKAYIAASNLTGCPFSFEIPFYASVSHDHSREAKPCWKNLDFPQFNARLHISYSAISPQSSLSQLTEDARSFVFKHTSKATSIDQKKIADNSKNVYGMEYFIQGNTASNYQFYVSDSSKHYLRGALYFNEKPHLDSIQPTLDFLKLDIERLIHTISWK